MKLNQISCGQLILLSALVLATDNPMHGATGVASRDYVAHEWGTFTSVQGEDGKLLPWQPLESSRLPQFVYDWKHPGLQRQPGNLFASKAAVQSLQRMETPVIYFYSAQEQRVDVSVQFPQGLITEWYPQAAQIGPSTLTAPLGTTSGGDGAHDLALTPVLCCGSLTADATLKESRAHWPDITLLPQQPNQNLAKALPQDRSGSHYFSARETDSDFLSVPSLATSHPTPEHEKFIFYRGVGNFTTPLRVTMRSDNSVLLENTGTEPLEHLFLLSLRQGAGDFIHVARLEPSEKRQLTANSSSESQPTHQLSDKLGREIATSLVQSGLYQREADAMVKTWTDSWFEEDGLRVLYILPRAWTDHILPLTLTPAPRELVRVMVGRAEVISPRVQRELTENLSRATQGDIQSVHAAVAELKRLGRFGLTALNLATKTSPRDVAQRGWELYQTAQTTP